MKNKTAINYSLNFCYDQVKYTKFVIKISQRTPAAEKQVLK